MDRAKKDAEISAAIAKVIDGTYRNQPVRVTMDDQIPLVGSSVLACQVWADAQSFAWWWERGYVTVCGVAEAWEVASDVMQELGAGAWAEEAQAYAWAFRSLERAPALDHDQKIVQQDMPSCRECGGDRTEPCWSCEEAVCTPAAKTYVPSATARDDLHVRSALGSA